MPELSDAIQKKLLQMKSLLGDTAAKQVLDAAEAREAAAKEAGVDFKGDPPEEETQLALSDLLAQIEAGVEDGSIVDDVNDAPEDEPDESGDEGEPKPEEGETTKAFKPFQKKKKGAQGAAMPMKGAMLGKEAQTDEDVALKELADFIGEVVDTRLAQFRKENAALYLPRTKEAERQYLDLRKSLKETHEREVALKAQIDELISPQPRRMKYRASQAEDTTLKEGDPKLKQAPQADPMNEFLDEFMFGGNGQGA